jgi:DNA-binding LacI/PurR family transcriptional regulator
LGHRRIAFLAGTHGASVGQERFEGYRRGTLAKLGETSMIAWYSLQAGALRMV